MQSLIQSVIPRSRASETDTSPLEKKFPKCYGNQVLITVLKNAYHLFVCWL